MTKLGQRRRADGSVGADPHSRVFRGSCGWAKCTGLCATGPLAVYVLSAKAKFGQRVSTRTGPTERLEHPCPARPQRGSAGAFDRSSFGRDTGKPRT